MSISFLTTKFGGYELCLIIAVTVMGTCSAYIARPQWKSFILLLPVPFTLATLSVGRPIDATNLAGLLLLLMYAYGVRILHYRFRLPIIPAIALPAGAYCLIATLLAPVLPRGPWAFWSLFVVTDLVGVATYLLLPRPLEPSYRTPLPVWLKAPIIAGIIAFLILIKGYLQGFMTMFPMVGLVTSYEARHSLWTVNRQITICLMTAGPMMAVCYLMQDLMSLHAALGVAWIAQVIGLYLTYPLWNPGNN